MTNFAKWCLSQIESEGSHEIVIVSEKSGQRLVGIDSIAAVVPGHYASAERVARLLKKLGKKKSAAYLEGKLPTSKSLRSGDLGEIIATSYVQEHTNYTHFVNRLRWKDHRNMAMRGDDILAIRENSIQKRLEFLKGEVKSRVGLTTAVLSEARKALRATNNRPSPHALSFVADRLDGQGKHQIADEIEKALLKDGIKLPQVEHFLFTFSENNPLSLLKANLAAYSGQVAQVTVGLYVSAHQKFIKAVYKKVIGNG